MISPVNQETEELERKELLSIWECSQNDGLVHLCALRHPGLFPRYCGWSPQVESQGIKGNGDERGCHMLILSLVLLSYQEVGKQLPAPDTVLQAAVLLYPSKTKLSAYI